MKYVALMGGLYRLTNERYFAFLAEIAREHCPDIERYGRYVDTLRDCTDLTAEEAEDRYYREAKSEVPE